MASKQRPRPASQPETEIIAARLSARQKWPLAVVLLALFLWLTLSAAGNKGPAYDELPHLTAGYSYWTTDDYRLFAESGNWSQRWMAIPAVVSDARFPDPGGAAWSAANVWLLGDRFFFSLGNSPEALLFGARLMVAILAVLLGGLVFWWSDALASGEGWPTAGVLSLLLFVLSPTILAHASLATADMGAALFVMAGTAALWAVLHRLTPVRLGASLVTVAGAALVKFSGLLIIPVAGVMLAVRLWANRPWRVSLFGRTTTHETRGAMLPTVGGLVVVHVLVAWMLVWASFGFRYSAAPPDSGPTEFLVAWETLSGHSSVVDATVQVARDHHLLPEAYVYGLAHTLRNAADRNAFFNGEVSTTGWAGFFPYAFLAKSTPGFLVVLVLGLFAVGRSRQWYDYAPLLILIGVYGGFALTSELNIGHRHLLPLYAPLFVVAGRAAHRLGGRGGSQKTFRLSTTTAIVVLAVAWHAADSWLVRPNYLSYFNRPSGGSSEGYRHLVDSSLDWGQDLPALKRWLEMSGVRASGEPAYLAYFGVDRPERYGLDAVRLPSDTPRALPTLRPGLYCVSATVLQAVYLPTPGAWTPEHEQFYRELEHNVGVFDATASNPQARAQLESQMGDAFWTSTFAEFDRVRLARLVAYLRRGEPLANVANTILVYRLSESEIAAAIAGPAELLY